MEKDVKKIELERLFLKVELLINGYFKECREIGANQESELIIDETLYELRHAVLGENL